jgi:arsenate reductase (glutaredoxin)
MTVTLYGIPNCDTVKKARVYLDGRGVAYTFHDYKKAGVDAADLKRWAKQVGWEVLLNKAGTTFKKLPDAEKTGIDEAKAIALMQANPSLIKRPVVEGGKTLLVGFKPEIYDAAQF